MTGSNWRRCLADIDVSRWPIDTDSPVTSIGLADVLNLKGSKNSMILTRLLKDHQPNLIWSAKREVIDYVNLERDQLVNHFPRAPFNTKVSSDCQVMTSYGVGDELTWNTASLQLSAGRSTESADL